MNDLKLIFAEVLHGFSRVGNLYVKHLTNYDSFNIELKKEYYAEIAKEKGLFSSEQKEKLLIEEGSWTVEKNSEISSYELMLDNLHKTKKLLPLEYQIKKVNEEIAETEKKIFLLKQEKFNALGLTVESFVNRKINEYYIKSSLFKDNQFSAPAHSDEEFDELEYDELNKITESYSFLTEKFSTQSLKKVSLSPFFSNIFHLSNDDAFKFYGKPIINLTFYQVELFSHGIYFKRLLSECKIDPPEDVMNDPEKLVEWFDATNNAHKLVEKEGSAAAIKGANMDDYERMGLVDSLTVNLEEEANKKGGNLDMKDFMRMQGIRTE